MKKVKEPKDIFAYEGFPPTHAYSMVVSGLTGIPIKDSTCGFDCEMSKILGKRCFFFFKAFPASCL
jgi:hypothetical protein